MTVMTVMTALAVLIGVLLDRVFGEVRRFHPLVGFGNIASALERVLNRRGKLLGILAWAVAVLPWVVLAWWFETSLSSDWVLVVSGAIGVYFAIGWRSLQDHVNEVRNALAEGDLARARQNVAMIVSRDCTELDEEGAARAATESTLENGADAIFASLFWFVVAGLPGVILHRLSNTLDAMWGYRNERFERFGWCAARIDDVLNFIPARLTALSYGFVGNYLHAKKASKLGREKWKSPNASLVMAAGAGAIDVRLGGIVTYHGKQTISQAYGLPNSPLADVNAIDRATELVGRSVKLWVLVIVAVSLIHCVGAA